MECSVIVPNCSRCAVVVITECPSSVSRKKQITFLARYKEKNYTGTVDNSNYVVHMYQGITDYTGTVDNSKYVVHMYQGITTMHTF